MRLSIWLTGVVALVLTGLALAAAWMLLNPAGPPLEAVSFSHTALTPNADGIDDVAVIRYTLRRPATVSIYFVNATGERFYFRREKTRQSGDNEVLFSGIVDSYRLPDDTFQGAILARVLPNGEYTWVVEAHDAQGESNQVTGALTVQDADTALPELLNLSVIPKIFTPNQDGLDDRARLTVYLSKDVNPDGLRLSLIGPNGLQVPIAESALSPKKPGERGTHEYDYDGGIDLNRNPPPDGDYIVRAEAEDRLGQKTAITSTLTIRDGGLPLAEIYQADVAFSSDVVVLGQTLYFTLTVYNYGNAPIRTTGPLPGYVYNSMSTNYNSTGFYQESGAFRIGLMCDTCKNDFPWRWALGTPDNLVLIPDSQGRPQYYLPKGARAVVTGGVALDEIIPSRNPQYFWAGLIHEEVAVLSSPADPHLIEIERP